MTRTSSLAIVISVAMTALFTGCSPTTEETPPPATNNAGGMAGSASRTIDATADTVRDAAGTVANEAGKATDAVGAQLKDAGKSLGNAATEVSAAANEKFEAVAAEVSRLIEQGKGTEAVQKLQSAASNLQLTPEQRQTLDNLLAKAKEAMKQGVEAASSAVGGLLKPKQN